VPESPKPPLAVLARHSNRSCGSKFEKAVLRHQLNVLRRTLLVVASSSQQGQATGATYAGWHHPLGNVTSTAALQTLVPVPLVVATAGVMIRGEHLSLSSIAA
jgi:hypothetical protein